MIRSKLVVKSGTYITGQRFQRKFAAVVNGIGAQVARDYTPQAQQAFADPGPVSRPIEWQSERQRKAFFATDGFGKGIPTRRTGKVVRGWQFLWTPEDTGGRLTLTNRVPYAKFVYGGFRAGNTFQQRMHIKTGWVKAIDQRDRLFVSVRDAIQRDFDEALGSFGFVDVGR